MTPRPHGIGPTPQSLIPTRASARRGPPPFAPLTGSPPGTTSIGQTPDSIIRTTSVAVTGWLSQ